jgi:hypothetical protein
MVHWLVDQVSQLLLPLRPPRSEHAHVRVLLLLWSEHPQVRVVGAKPARMMQIEPRPDFYRKRYTSLREALTFGPFGSIMLLTAQWPCIAYSECLLLLSR